MRKIFALILVLLHPVLFSGQVKLTVFPDSLFTTYYHQRWTLFQSLPQTENDIIFIGNSITDGGEWSELFNDVRIKNRGISGDLTAGVIKRIDEVVDRKPARVFLMIGINDLAKGTSPDSVVKNILLIAGYLQQQSPSTKLFVQSILPVNDIFGKFNGHTSKAGQINELNEKLKRNSAIHHYSFIDLYSSFSDENGKLDSRYTNDGLHLQGEGYQLWKHLVYPHIYGLQEKPSLLPAPQQLSWKKGFFPLYKCRSVIISQQGIEKESGQLLELLRSSGVHAVIKDHVSVDELHIELRLANVESPVQREEACKLDVSEKRILITANTAHGIFNGIQTLRQLMRDGSMVDACEISDWPAFSWRGYMTDVGRNYMSVPLLKQQIDVMSRYKLNVFHFHATEDIAWRIAIRQYPQLTAPENMLRNKGMYYTDTEIRELIQYCRERHIVFVPEIDMPGHSAAFKRAMKTDMQSDTGLQYVKNILTEFCTTYDVPYIHIGADEVKITNQDFIPEITKHIESFGKKVIGWQPGGNFNTATIRQLWMDDKGHFTGNEEIKFIDSRHLYLNHMDPLEAVVTLFNRKLCERERGSNTALGATLCLWHDRAVSKEEDILAMNPVYPGMLAFAERSWQGGGEAGWVANISPERLQLFTEFENRLLDHQQQYFRHKQFAYLRQADLRWKLIGPFDNKGEPSEKFLPEKLSPDELQQQPGIDAVGGTIVLRHWWAPLIKGVLDKPVENTTWYAVARIWSNETGVKKYWIGFNNLSRSPATDSPPEAAWDNKGSMVWVNGKMVSAPDWKRPAQKGHPEIPLTDEGYEYREPASILLKKGWNHVLIKAPVTSFKGKDWQNPVKWMFTFVCSGE